ncbi:MAG: MASE1 domain-containing protein [Promethearchaeota archaeon]
MYSSFVPEKAIIKRVIINFFIAITVLGLGKLSKAIIFDGGLVISIYLPCGFSLAVLWRKNKFNTIGIFIGSVFELFTSGIQTNGPFTLSVISLSIIVSLNNTIHIYAVAVFLERFVKKKNMHFFNTKAVIQFIIIILGITAIFAASGALIIIRLQYATFDRFVIIWITWLISDIAGFYLLTPFFIIILNKIHEKTMPFLRNVTHSEESF